MNQEKALKQLAQLKRLAKKPKDLRLAAEYWKSPFQILISTILSARTRDEVTIPVAEKLFEKYPTAEKLSKSKITDIEKIINPVNFYKNKSKYLLNCSNHICNIHNNNVPPQLDVLLTLPGVGRKTANVFLSEIGQDAIGVDTHVAYISKKLCWTNNSKPHKIESDLKKLFSKKHWKKLNPILVRFGKTYTSKDKKDKLLDVIKKIK